MCIQCDLELVVLYHAYLQSQECVSCHFISELYLDYMGVPFCMMFLECCKQLLGSNQIHLFMPLCPSVYMNKDEFLISSLYNLKII